MELPQPEDKARRGIYAAAISPLDAGGRLDAPKLAGYCRHLLSAEGGCDGVAPLGTTGEGVSLALSDRMAVPEALARAGLPGERVILGTGAASVEDAAALSRAALAAGYRNVLVLPPFYYKNPSEDGLHAAYARLIEAVGDDRLRLYLYHFPKMSAVPLPATLAARLKRDFGPVVAGLKDSTGDIAVSRGFIEATGGVAADFDVFSGSEALLFDVLGAGGAGVISGSTNAFGALAQAALQAPEGAAREAAMERVRAARAIAGKYSVMAAMKQAEAWRTGDESWLGMAPPLVPLDAAERENLRADLASVSGG